MVEQTKWPWRFSRDTRRQMKRTRIFASVWQRKKSLSVLGILCIPSRTRETKLSRKEPVICRAPPSNQRSTRAQGEWAGSGGGGGRFFHAWTCLRRKAPTGGECKPPCSLQSSRWPAPAGGQRMWWSSALTAKSSDPVQTIRDPTTSHLCRSSIVYEKGFRAKNWS